MGDRLFGVETEYALSATTARGARADHRVALDGLMRRARGLLPHLPDELSHGMFLQNASRFYVDCGGHPEFTTPECDNPWDVVRYIRAGESILLRLVDGQHEPTRAARSIALYRSNVDYSGSGSTWGSHESYMHDVDPDLLPPLVVPHLVSRVVYAGAGGWKNVSRGLEFTLSPRAAHIRVEISGESTSNRGIFHAKEEHLCRGHRRLHVLCGESTGSELATWLRVGATALVVALCDAGLSPGKAVALRNPVAALHLFAGDPTCTAKAEMTDGRQLTAVEIQRHYLEQVEAHVGAAVMPSWAGEVCRRWRGVLDGLESGGAAWAATSLDWAIKLALYRDRAARSGFAWESLGQWSESVAKLTAVLPRALRSGAALRVELAGTSDGVVVGLARRQGVCPDTLGRFVALRDELFEVDTRFGQLGQRGVFAALDAAGVLTHHLDGVDDIERAIYAPPRVARARLRGRFVRELSGNGERYRCNWQGILDCKDGRRIDLSDPFATKAEWQEPPADDGGMSSPTFLTGLDRRLALLRERLGRRGADPLELNEAALEHRKRGELDDAERLLRQAIDIEDRRVPADSPKRPHRRNNLAIVLMRAGKVVESRELNAEAWRQKAGRHDVTSGRILFVRIALGFIQGAREAAPYLGQLKTLLHQQPMECFGNVARVWDIPDVIAMVRILLPPAQAELLANLAEALNDPGSVPALGACGAWDAAALVALETPWPESRGRSRD